MTNLEHFVEAQSPVMDQVLAELRAGRKHTHWMWFVFPQLQGLGHSRMSWMFGLASLEEARSYLDHPILGRRLLECTNLVLSASNRTPLEIFGQPDDLKFHSSMTLFARTNKGVAIFQEAITKFFKGQEDQGTCVLLANEPRPLGAGRVRSSGR